jgi:7-dehydrocholesterol reductase
MKKQDVATAANGSNGITTSGDWSAGIGVLPGRDLVGPLLLMGVTPPFSIIFWHLLAERRGDWIGYVREIQSKGSFGQVLYDYWPSPWNKNVWIGIATYLIFQILLMKFVPGKRFVGNVTPKGNRPVYTANGLQCYVITLLTAFAIQKYELWDLALIYDHYGELLSSLNVLSWLLCFTLFVKGRIAPSSSDSGTTGSLLYDFYWGMELYPRIAGVDIKMLTNCRGGMMFWAVAIVAFAAKNAQLQEDLMPTPAIMASVVIQLVYISK